GGFADLAQGLEQLEDQAAALDPAAAGDLVHGVADDRLVQPRLLVGEGDDAVMVDLAGQFGGDAGVGLAPAQHERGDEPGEACGGGRARILLDGAVAGAEGGAGAEEAGVGPVEDGPQFGEGVLDRGAGDGEPGPG